MKRNKCLVYLLLLAILSVSGACLRSAEQQVILQVENPSGKSLEITRRELTTLRHTGLDATDKEGTTARYEGVDLVDILRAADAPLGNRLRGENMSGYVTVEGADGYQVSFTLAELDPDFTGQAVLLADRRDGQPLAEDEGPLRLVVPAETKRNARWVRQVVKVKIKAVE